MDANVYDATVKMRHTMLARTSASLSRVPQGHRHALRTTTRIYSSYNGDLPEWFMYVDMHMAANARYDKTFKPTHLLAET